jgi:hypothetical protein
VRRFVKVTRLQCLFSFVAVILCILGLVRLVGPSVHAATQNPVPYPGALRNHPFAKAWSPTDLYNWGPGSNAPGNCSNPNTGEITNHDSYVELSTTGATGDCVDLESPHEYPTTDGYVYEAEINVSNWTQWLSFWMYGSNWPVGGEIDAIEGGSGRNYVSYHYEGANGPTSVSNCNNTNGCDANAGPITQPGNSETLSNISPGTHIIDISYGGCGSGCGAIGVWYDGTEVALVSGTYVLDGGSTNDPYWITFSTGSCNSASNGNVCGSQGQTSGDIQIEYLRAFS